MSTGVLARDFIPASSALKQEMVRRADGLTIHPLETSCRDPQYMVRMRNGKLMRISGKVRDLLDELDAPVTVEQVASNLACLWRQVVTPEDVQLVIDRLLKPSHLMAEEGGETPESTVAGKRSFWWRKFLLQDFFFSFKLIPSSIVTPIARRTAPLVNKYLAPVVIIMLVLVNLSAYREFTALRDAGEFKITEPSQYLLVLIFIFVSIVFHEFGHASAVVKFGGTPDNIGFGLYFIYPALYANVNQSWYFSRKQRVVIDLGGIYFQIIASLVWYGAYLKTHGIGFLLTFLILELLWVYSLIPFFKFDGYWFVSDSLGVPNLRRRAFQLLGRKARALIRGKREGDRLDLDLPTGIQIGVTLYGAGLVAFMGFVMWMLIRYAPQRVAQYPAYARGVFDTIGKAASAHSYSLITIEVIQLFLRTMMLLGFFMICLSFVASLHQSVRSYLKGRSS